MVEILENRANWYKHYQETGEADFKQYQYSRNEESVSGKGVDLSKSRLVFITTSGAYIKDSQAAYDAENALGDYTLRTFPVDTPLDKLAFAHTHYNHKYVDEDTQVLVPLKHLADMVSESKIGELAPQVVGMAKEQQADAALLVPA